MNASAPRLDLYQTLKQGHFDHAVICTYEFGPSFFEEDCLENFHALPDNSSISILLDRGVYEGLIASDLNALKQANRRYLLHPVSFSTRGVFHPKLFLFVTPKKGLLLVGSANCTEAGLKRNAEMVGQYQYEIGKREESLPLFQQAFAFLRAVEKECPGEALRAHLDDIAHQTSWLVDEPATANSSPMHLIHNLQHPLWPQICEGLQDVDALHILAPYYDSKPAILQRMHKDLQPRQINIYTQNGKTTLTPKWLQAPLVEAGEAKIHLCEYRDEERRQSLHAKAFAVVDGDSCRFAFGSANCTSAALMKTAAQGNVEIMLLFDAVSKRTLNPKRVFDPLDNAQLLTDAEMLETREAEPFHPASAAHGLRLYEATVVGQKIRCEVEMNSHMGGKLRVILTLADQEIHSLALSHEEGPFFSAALPPELEAKINEAASAVRLEWRADDAGEEITSSNAMLLTDLQDGETGGSVRPQRQVQQATQSAAGFLLAWRDLIRYGDDDDLMDFLISCNIAVNVPRPLVSPRDRPSCVPVAGMKPIASQDLPYYQAIDDAARAFIDKHFKKLETHLGNVDLDSAPNFMHIALAIAGVIQVQVERDAVTLEAFGPAAPAIIIPQEWNERKKHLDCYYDFFGKLLLYVAQYIVVLCEEYKMRYVKLELKPDLKSWHEANNYMLSLRERIEECRTQRLRIVLPSKNIVPAYSLRDDFYQNIFAPHNWSKYQKKSAAMTSLLDKLK